MNSKDKLYLWVMLYGFLTAIVVVLGFPFQLAGLWLVNLCILVVGLGLLNWLILTKILKYVS